MVEALRLGSVPWGSCKEFEEHVHNSLKCFEYILCRSLNFEEASSESLKENEENRIGNWKRESLCYTAAKNSATLRPAVM